MTPVKLSPAEGLKSGSRHLRGALAEELANDSASFTKPTNGLLKFHGVYQQDDRDIRKAGPKTFTCMVRVSVPGGRLTAKKYLVLDRLANEVGDGSLRITSRGGVQYHYVGKTSLKQLVRSINDAGMSTFAACGDVVRNVVCDAAPLDRPDVQPYVLLINRELKPRTGAYCEIWLDGEKAASFEEESEPLYGDSYLPRKFKFGFAYPGENTTDVYANDIGIVPHFDGGALQGFTLLAGGGMGMSNGIKDTYPRLADPFAFIEPDDLLAAAKVAVTIHRDFGDRVNRKRARLKYIIEERGIAWFRQEFETRLGKPVADPRPLTWTRQADYLGWHPQAGGGWFYGLRVVSGRLAGTLRAAVRKAVEKFGCEVRFTPQQNVYFTGLREEDKAEFEAILAPAPLPPVLMHSMSCPALPTCGMALAESERVHPEVMNAVQAELDAAGLGSLAVIVRTTGCPNGCARPYTAEIGIVGMSPNLYSLYLGGSPLGTRLATLHTHNVKLEQIGETLRPLIREYAAAREPGEAFGDFCHRKAEH